jgi:hypothetical protein
LALLSLPLSSSSATNIFWACGAAPILGWPAAQKAESRESRSGTTPSFGVGWGVDLVLSLAGECQSHRRKKIATTGGMVDQTRPDLLFPCFSRLSVCSMGKCERTNSPRGTTLA